MYTQMFIVLNNSVFLIEGSHSVLGWKLGLRQLYSNKLMAVYCCGKEQNCFFNSTEVILQEWGQQTYFLAPTLFKLLCAKQTQGTWEYYPQLDCKLDLPAKTKSNCSNIFKWWATKTKSNCSKIFKWWAPIITRHWHMRDIDNRGLWTLETEAIPLRRQGRFEQGSEVYPPMKSLLLIRIKRLAKGSNVLQNSIFFL